MPNYESLAHIESVIYKYLKCIDLNIMNNKK